MSNLHLDIDISFNQLVGIVKQVSPSEKIKLNEFIWNENSEIPIEHKKFVLNRIKKAKENPNRMLNWDEAFKTLKP